MNKDDIKHHKYTKVNKHERKKNKIKENIILKEEPWFKCLKPIYTLWDYFTYYYYGINAKLKPNYIGLKEGYRPYDYDNYYRYQQASHKLVWNDANHTSCRILVKKQKTYKFVTKRPFRGINYKISIAVFDRLNLFR